MRFTLTANGRTIQVRQLQGCDLWAPWVLERDHRFELLYGYTLYNAQQAINFAIAWCS